MVADYWRDCPEECPQRFQSRLNAEMVKVAKDDSVSFEDEQEEDGDDGFFDKVKEEEEFLWQM